MRTNQDYSQWYNEVYPQLTNHGIWLRGSELNTLAKEEYEARRFKLLLVRLSTYDDVARSFAHQLLYQIASEIPHVFPDIAYLPPKNDTPIFERYAIPWLLGTNTKFGPERFSLIAFSNAIVQEILNIPQFLKTSNIPLKTSERLERKDIPLIILGGSNSIYTTSLWGNESLVDGVFIGADSDSIRKIFETCADGYKNNIAKIEILRRLEDIPGFYVTSAPRKSLTTATTRSEKQEILGKAIVPYNEDEIGSGYLQISDGCRAFCSFCSESWIRKPYRESDASFLFEKALIMKAEMGLESIDFFSFNFNMYSQFYKLLWDCSNVFKNISLKSQRFDMFAHNSSMAEYQVASGKAVFSCGLEGISERLRRYLNKNLDNDALYKSVELIFKIQARELKIFLLSTGIEDEPDFNEFNELVNKIKNIRKDNHARTRVIFSITPLVKFPWTPLEFDKAYPPEAHDKIISKMSRIITRHEFEARQAMDTKEYLISQILVRASDLRVKEALLSSLEETGFIYYTKVSYEFYASFKQHLQRLGLEIEDLLDGFSIDKSCEKPWAVIDTGVERKLLWEIFQKNIRFEETKADFNKLEIYSPDFTTEQYRELTQKKRADECRRDFYVTVSKLARGIPRKYFGVVLARALMKTDSSLVPYFRSYAGSFWEKDDSSPNWVIGDDIISLSWDKKAIPILDKVLADPSSCGMVNAHLGPWGLLSSAMADDAGVHKLRLDSPYDFDGVSYFKKRGLKYTLRKRETGYYQLEFSDKSIKKKIISQCEFTIKNKVAGMDDFKVSVGIVPGEKFNIEDFLQEAFIFPRKEDWLRIIVTSKNP